MKTGVKSKLLLCFRPVAMDEALTSDGQEGSGDSVLAYIAVADKGDIIIPTILSPFSENDSLKVFRGDMVIQKNRAGRNFYRIVKSVLFDTLSKKVCSGKVRQYPYRSDSSLPVVDEKPVSGSCRKLSDSDDRKINLTVSSSWVSSYSSTLISSPSLSSSFSSPIACPWPIPGSKNSSRLNSFKPKQNNRPVESKQSNLQELPQRKKKRVPSRCCSCYSGLYLLLISLFVMIFWGRVWAILCTSTWLYFLLLG